MHRQIPLQKKTWQEFYERLQAALNKASERTLKIDMGDLNAKKKKLGTTTEGIKQSWNRPTQGLGVNRAVRTENYLQTFVLSITSSSVNAFFLTKISVRRLGSNRMAEPKIWSTLTMIDRTEVAEKHEGCNWRRWRGVGQPPCAAEEPSKSSRELLTKNADNHLVLLRNLQSQAKSC